MLTYEFWFFSYATSTLVDIGWRLYKKSLYYHCNCSLNLKFFLDKLFKPLQLNVLMIFYNMAALITLNSYYSHKYKQKSWFIVVDSNDQ